ncbi:MAG: cation transporter, partial [Treponema sp.]|nr:cation transporter [Treponema sp.]
MNETIRIGGMTCVNCQNKIGKTLQSTAGIESAEVNYNAGTAVLSYDAAVISMQEITSIIERLGYRVITGNAAEKSGLSRIFGLCAVIIAAFLIIQHFGLTGFFNKFPLAESGMGYGMILLIGIITSVHCVAMCGGINL